jgi:hypothetical protein
MVRPGRAHFSSVKPFGGTGELVADGSPAGSLGAGIRKSGIASDCWGRGVVVLYL